MCLYKYVFNKHMLKDDGGWGGEGDKSGADSGIYFRRRPVLARGLGIT